MRDTISYWLLASFVFEHMILALRTGTSPCPMGRRLGSSNPAIEGRPSVVGSLENELACRPSLLSNPSINCAGLPAESDILSAELLSY